MGVPCGRDARYIPREVLLSARAFFPRVGRSARPGDLRPPGLDAKEAAQGFVNERGALFHPPSMRWGGTRLEAYFLRRLRGGR